jgi:2-methylcitrate dehydratase PrpD
MGLDRQQLTHALGIAASASSGLFAFLDDGGDVKRLHAGQASRAGLLAAHFAAEGISGPRNILEVPSGFAHAFAYGEETGRLAFALPPDAPYRTPLCYIKPYACCRHLQPAIDAMLDIMRAHGLSADDIETVEVEAYSIAAAHAETGWSDFASAQLSFPFVMAIAALHGTVLLSHFDDDVRNAPAVAKLARRFSFRATAEMDALYPRQRPSRVLLRANGQSFHAFAAEALGAPEKPLDDRRLEEKFDSLVAPVLGLDRARQARDLVWSLDQAASCRPLLEVLTRER